MIKILIADKLANEGVELLKSMDGVEPVVKTGMSEDELIACIGEYDGVIVRSATKITAKVLENPGKFKAVARAGVGVDNIDITAATRKGVIVMNTPGGNTLSAAEHTMALMLAMSRSIVPACNSLMGGAWDRKKYMGNQLNNKVLGLIGLGRIGLSVAKMAMGFNMKVIGYDPMAAPAEAEKLGVEITDDLNKIITESDFISMHVPKNEKTIDMISAEQLKMMKPTTRIVNCARGGVINEDALYDALKDNVIAGAALDVFNEEPPKNTRFQELTNCVVTPHLGASTEEAQIEVAVEAAQILVDAIKGGPIKNALNAPAMGGSTPPIVIAYADLASRIGTIMSTVAGGQVKSIELRYGGSLAEHDASVIATSFEIALLQPFFEDTVNIVNVGLMAKERGITIEETKSTDTSKVASSFTAKVTTASGVKTIGGTVFSESILRVIEIDGFDVEMTPSDTVMIIFNDDKPGVIGAVGTVCGKHGVNIQTMGVGQKAAESKAVLAVSLDAQPDDKMIAEIKGLDFVNEVYICKLS